MSLYHEIITEATGTTDRAQLEAIEDCMRHTIFHSTLDWQSREELHQAARESVALLAAEGLAGFEKLRAAQVAVAERPFLLIPDHGSKDEEYPGQIEPGAYSRNEVVALLRTYRNNPDAIRFIADMLEA